MRCAVGIWLRSVKEYPVTQLPTINLAPVDALLRETYTGTENNNGVISTEALIPLLQAIQKEYGYLPAEALRRLSQRTRIPESHIQGVVTFYAQFHREPRGKHTVTFCCGTACHVRGGKQLLETSKDIFEIKEGGTTQDGQVSLEATACLGACALAPVMVVDGRYYGKLSQQDAEQVMRSTLQEEQSWNK